MAYRAASCPARAALMEPSEARPGPAPRLNVQEPYGLVQKLGTLLNLADCYERSGRTASAWVRFTEAATMAERAGQQERTEFARAHAATLLPRLARVTISVDRPGDEGLVVRRDGAIVDAAAFGTPVPVDPGTHSVEASAPHRRTWTSSIAIERDASGDHAVAIPALRRRPRSDPRRLRSRLITGRSGPGPTSPAASGSRASPRAYSLGPWRTDSTHAPTTQAAA